MATIEAVPEESTPTPWLARFARVEAALTYLGDYLNPILVKEARQALKSRQFTITFILVLVAGWCWSIIGIAWIGPNVYWSSAGPSMFFGYFLILAFPLIVIVPYGAFRSLASEREDRTYELLSITTLRPTQIIAGKLAGAVLQMMVYFSAISPCLTFTYLLRGLDIVTIAAILVYLFFGSLGLALVCLLLSTACNEKYQQVVLSVAIVFGLGYAFIGACVIAAEMLSWNAGFDRDEFWIVNAAFATTYVGYFAMFYLAAAAQLAFAGSNRSTPLRIAAVVQQALFVAWIGGLWVYDGADDEDFLMATLLITGVHWYVMGIFMTGESNELSPRVKRDLPQSFLGRAFFTWFNPGPATGYVFSLVNFFAIIVLVLMAMLLSNDPVHADVLLWCILGLAYLALFLGLGRFLLAIIRRYSPVTVVTRVLIHVLLLTVGTAIPLTIQLTLPTYRYGGYSVLQLTNPFWTLEAAYSSSPPGDVWAAATLLSLAGVVMALLSLPAITEEVRQVRIAAPQRVLEEDAELSPPSLPTRSSPWDDVLPAEP